MKKTDRVGELKDGCIMGSVGSSIFGTSSTSDVYHTFGDIILQECPFKYCSDDTGTDGEQVVKSNFDLLPSEV